MKTKVTILGQEPTTEQKKPIEFVYQIDIESNEIPEVKTPIFTPSDYENIMLLKRKYSGGLDLMMAWDNRNENLPSRGLFTGHFNDGVV